MLANEMRSELENRIIPYWKKLRDEVNGGYYGYVDFDLKVHKDSVKGCILNSRILWFFSSAYSVLGDETLLREAQHAYSFLKEACLDKEHGGVFWSLNSLGLVEDSTKHTYNQAFAIYALSAYFEASKDPEALEIAWSLFHKIEDVCTDSYGYLESFDREWCPQDNDKLSENGLLADKTMNTLLHVLEAYTEFYKVTQSETIREKLLWILDLFRFRVFNEKKGQLEVFFDAEMNTISDLYSYGHDIEASWLIDRACEVLGNEVLTKEMEAITGILADSVYQTAMDNGSMKNECFHGEEDSRRIWWVQAEAVVGFTNAYEKNGSELYHQAALQIWRYIGEYMTDKRPGSEWFWELNERNEPFSKKPITEPWKCPYHNGRMCLEIIRRMG